LVPLLEEEPQEQSLAAAIALNLFCVMLNHPKPHPRPGRRERK
jgi:hypothetical protein